MARSRCQDLAMDCDAGGVLEMANSKLLLLSGPFSVGKSSLTKELTERHAFMKVSTSSYLNALIPDAFSLDAVKLRRAQQIKGDQLDDETDFGWVVRPVTVNALLANPLIDRWIVDAVRKPRQVTHFRDQFGGAVYHAHLHASDVLLRSRYAGSDQDYASAVAHSNEQSARGLGVIADVVIDVDGLSPAELALRIVQEMP